MRLRPRLRLRLRLRLGSCLVIGLGTSLTLAADAQQQPQLQPKVTQAPPNSIATKIMGTQPWITEVKGAYNDDGFYVLVMNPTSSTAEIGVLYKGKSNALKLIAGNKSQVLIKDAQQPAMCTERSFEFQLTGTNVDTRVRRLKYTGAPTFTVTEQDFGPAGLPGQQANLILLRANNNGGATYECGKKLRLKVNVENNTNVAAQNLKLRMNDINGDKIGEESVTIAAQSKKTVTIESTSAVSGRTGISGRITLVDAGNEFTAKQLSTNPVGFSVSQSGLGDYAATFE